MATELSYENRDVLYAVVAPAYEVMARFVPAWVSPNHLTLLGLASAAGAFVALAGWSGPGACLVAAACVLGYEILDSLDGKHARNTGQSSRFGAYLDTSVDGLAAGLIYTGVICHFQLFHPLFVLAIGIRMAKACLVYASAAETRLRINPEIGTTVENLILALVLASAWAWPAAYIDLGAMVGPGALHDALVATGAAHFDAIRASMLFVVGFLPLSSIGDVLEVKRLLEPPAAQAGASAGQ